MGSWGAAASAGPASRLRRLPESPGPLAGAGALACGIVTVSECSRCEGLRILPRAPPTICSGKVLRSTEGEMDVRAKLLRNAISPFSLPHWLLQPDTPNATGYGLLLPRLSGGGLQVVLPLFLLWKELLVPRLPCGSESCPELTPGPFPPPPPSPSVLQAPAAYQILQPVSTLLASGGPGRAQLTSCAASPGRQPISVQRRGCTRCPPLAPSGSSGSWVCPAGSADNLAGGRSRRPCCCFCTTGPGNPRRT